MNHGPHLPPGTTVQLRARDQAAPVIASVVRWIPAPHAYWCEVELRFDPPFSRFGEYADKVPWHLQGFRRLYHAAFDQALVRVGAA